MKKILFAVLLLALWVTGCIPMHYGKPHGQDISVEHSNKIPANVGLYLPETLIKDSIEVTIGDDFLSCIHTTPFQLNDGEAFATAIQKSVLASFTNIIILDSLGYSHKKDSIQLIIKPSFVNRKSELWRSFDTLTTTFESRIRLDINDNSEKFIDSIIITAIGVSSRKVDSSKVVDSIMADAADSAIKSLQDQIIEKLKKNTSIRTLLSLPLPTDSVSTTMPRHGLYGAGTIFSLDTISQSLVAIPPIRRWSIWDDIHGMSFEPERMLISISADLLLHSHLSFRFGIGILNYYYHGLDSFTFVNNQFQLQTNDVSRFDWILLTRVSYLFFGPRNFLEVGLGMNTELGKWFTGKITVPDQQRFQPLGIIGFRHQSIWFGSTFGASYNPYLDAQGLKHGFAINVGFGL